MLSVAFPGALVAPDVADLSDKTRDALDLVFGAFAAELFVLALLAPSLRRLAREHWLDVLIVGAPFVRPLRIARLRRLVRAGSGRARILTAVRRVTPRTGFQAYLAVTVVVNAGAGMLLWAVERRQPDATITTVGDALWWASSSA